MNLKKFLPIAILVALLVSVAGSIFPAFSPTMPVDGDIYALYSGTARYIVQEAIAGKHGAFIMENNAAYIFVRGYQQGFGFVLANKSDLSILKDPTLLGGNLVNVHTWEQFQTYLTNDGWKVVETVPPAMQVLQLLAAPALVTFAVLPVGAFEIQQDFLNQIYFGVPQ